MGLKFGDKLKNIRIERNMSQGEFAALLGTSKQVISRYENSQRTPKITIAQEYSDKLNVPLNYLIDDNDEEVNEIKNADEITFDDFTYALHNESKELTDENKQKLLEMAKLFKLSQDQDKK